MTQAKVDRDECPVPTCDEEPDLCIVSTDPVKLTTQNIVHERTCLVPTDLDGEPAFYIVYHKQITPPNPDYAEVDDDPEPADAEPDADPDDEGNDVEPDPEPPDDKADEPDDQPDEQPEDEDDDTADPDALPEKARVVYDKIVAKGPIDQSALAGALADAEITPEMTDAIIMRLKNDGFVTVKDGEIEPT